MCACRRGACVTASSDVRVMLVLDTWFGFERRVTSRGVGACASHASRGREGRQYKREDRRSAGCRVAADRGHDRACGESANLL